MAMGVLLNKFFNSFIFWAAWIAIPMVMEIIPSLGSFFILLKRRKEYDKKVTPTIYPEISIIIPIYNSADTLEACLRSINDGAYPNKSIRIFLVNNHSRDNSFEVYTRCQGMFPDLHMQWLNAQQGKSRALNLALYNSEGKYIVHIDSDGLLEAHALTNLVDLFESDFSCNCVTGSILTDPEKVEEYKGPGLLLRRLEFMEYAQAFLAGRNYASETNAIYTLSGAFSAFRKSAILKSWLYNTDTICEDTQLTFQMRYLQKERVRISVDSIFLTDPIEDMDKLYTQRQRWQRGSLEVSKMFMDTDKLSPFKIFSDVNVNTLMYDHTFAFPRMIWYLATICMLFLGFSGTTILTATAALFGLYTICGYLYFFTSLSFLKQFPDLRAYYRKNWWVVPLLPFFNLMVFFIRMAGIVNSIGTDSSWKTRTFTDERNAFKDTVKGDFSRSFSLLERLRNFVNGDEEAMYAPRTLEQKLKSPLSGWLTGLVFLLSAGLLSAVWWTTKTFRTTFQGMIHALPGPLDAAGREVLSGALWTCLPPVLAALVVAGALFWLDRRAVKRTLRAQSGPDRERRGRRLLGLRHLAAALTCLLLCGSLAVAGARWDLPGMVAGRLSQSTVYEDYYVDPLGVVIAPPERPKNLIYLYLEGMETTYTTAGEDGENLIPNLTALARDNLSFSSTDQAPGGFYATTGADWTTAGIYATASGVPYALPGGRRAPEKAESYASGLTTLTDILMRAGYQNEFLCGTDADATGLGQLYRQHGECIIFDRQTAVDRGDIPGDYRPWRGFEDARLYAYAKEELARLAQSGRPFSLTLLTGDTHFPEGYLCSACGDSHSQRPANVIACADAQAAAFVDWCRGQDFFANTLIVITGDHPQTGASLVGNVPWEERSVYNCLINAPATDAWHDRQFTSLDLFPTVLTALGFDIQAERLGLGTELFSGRPTLAETMGLAAFDRALAAPSGSYIDHFAPELSGR